MNKPTLDDIMNGRVQTRGGKGVKIYAHDPELEQPVIGYIDEEEDVDQWSENGSFRHNWTESDYDLVLKPEFVKPKSAPVWAIIEDLCDKILEQTDLIHMNAPVIGLSKIEPYIEVIKIYIEDIRKINGATNHDTK